MVYVCLSGLYLFGLWFVVVCRFVFHEINFCGIANRANVQFCYQDDYRTVADRFSGVAQLNCRNMDILNCIL